MNISTWKIFLCISQFQIVILVRIELYIRMKTTISNSRWYMDQKIHLDIMLTWCKECTHCEFLDSLTKQDLDSWTCYAKDNILVIQNKNLVCKLFGDNPTQTIYGALLLFVSYNPETSCLYCIKLLVN